MNYTQEARETRIHGSAYIRSRKTAAKRITRLRRRIRSGQPVHYGGVVHHTGCPCYDCGYGEVARERRNVASERAGRVVPDAMLQAETFHRTGRFCGAGRRRDE